MSSSTVQRYAAEVERRGRNNIIISALKSPEILSVCLRRPVQSRAVNWWWSSKEEKCGEWIVRVHQSTSMQERAEDVEAGVLLTRGRATERRTKRRHWLERFVLYNHSLSYYRGYAQKFTCIFYLLWRHIRHSHTQSSCGMVSSQVKVSELKNLQEAEGRGELQVKRKREGERDILWDSYKKNEPTQGTWCDGDHEVRWGQVRSVHCECE